MSVSSSGILRPNYVLSRLRTVAPSHLRAAQEESDSNSTGNQEFVCFLAITRVGVRRALPCPTGFGVRLTPPHNLPGSNGDLRLRYLIASTIRTRAGV